MFIIMLLLCAIAALIIIGIPLFFYVLVSRYFYPQVVMIEDEGPLRALGRSAGLVRGSWWRVFGIGIVFLIMLFVIGLIATIPSGIAGLGNSTVSGILQVVGQALVLPIGYIGATVVYLDLRTRNEGYTLGTMEQEVGAP